MASQCLPEEYHHKKVDEKMDEKIKEKMSEKMSEKLDKEKKIN